MLQVLTREMDRLLDYGWTFDGDILIPVWLTRAIQKVPGPMLWNQHFEIFDHEILSQVTLYLDEGHEVKEN